MTDSANEESSWVVLPGGIFTADGIWFHTSEDDLESFASAVIDRYGLSLLLQKAADWVILPVSLSVLSLGLLLLIANPWVAFSASIGIFIVLSVLSPSTVFFGLIPFVRKLNHPIFQGLLYVLILSFLASSGQMAALVTGLVGFIVYRWRIVTRLTAPLVKSIRARISPLEAPDLILRNVLIRAALKHGIEIGALGGMQQRMLEIMHYRKKGSKKPAPEKKAK